MRILIVEDEQDLRSQLSDHLTASGYAVDSAADGKAGCFQGMEYPYDAAVIDLGLPQMSGMELIQALRKAGRDFPILILTARGRWEDKVAGLEAGGDDYLVKPFHFEELRARLNALIRRAQGFGQPKIACGPLLLNTAEQQLYLSHVQIELTAYEYRLIEYLILHAGEVVSKTELVEHIYDQEFDRDSNVIEVFIGRLRRKLSGDPGWHPIETLRGRGYRFTESCERCA